MTQDFTASPISGIPGANYINDFLTPDEQDELMAAVDANLWQTNLKRRVQHYGAPYDYKRRTIADEQALSPLPDWIAFFGRLLHEQGWFDRMPDQAIVNEYLPGQGISPHVDLAEAFDRSIASVTLASTCVMEFTRAGVARIPVLLKPRSCLILQDEARWDWKHAIPKRKKDVFEGVTYIRERRVSVTFRCLRQRRPV